MGVTAAVLPLVGGLLVTAGLVATVRLLLGPSTLDRLVAADMMLAILLCGLGVLCIGRSDLAVAPVVLAAALLAFVSSTAVVRMLGRRS